jgi:hypothetical protein
MVKRPDPKMCSAPGCNNVCRYGGKYCRAHNRMYQCDTPEKREVYIARMRKMARDYYWSHREHCRGLANARFKRIADERKVSCLSLAYLRGERQCTSR